AFWGIAMTLSHAPPEPALLAHAWAAVERAKAAGSGTARERDYIAAIEVFYRDWETRAPRTRVLEYERAMAALAARYPDDPEAAIFHALALSATALPTDKTYGRQLEAAAMLEKQLARRPDHPGVAHYLIHAYDHPGLAERGLAAARRFAAIAPSVPHALHMPSHIFTRQGLWEESIASNRASVAAARHEHDRLHALDYLVYAHLQVAQDREAERIVAEVRALERTWSEDFVIAHALAAIPARYAVERGRWAEAAALSGHPRDFSWRRFPQAEALTVFARGLGAARSGDLIAAAGARDRLTELASFLSAAAQEDWAEQATIQGLVVAGWLAHAEGRPEEGLRLLGAAAAREDATEKHPVTPGPIAPAREVLGELLLELGRTAEALRAFEAVLRSEPKRFRSLHGATRAAELAGDLATTRIHATMLVALTERAVTERPELAHARGLLRKANIDAGGSP
ncbi:MAG: hypothetical protein L0027_10890, partial [Candidatus Rokubacteria bacterium]|nr:hypothetical protein [Candidatus Rokubacteria bacterium]